jgi:hypothetical protein
MKKLRVRFKETTIDAYLARHGEGITEDHLFLPTNSPLEPGTHVRFELMLADCTPFLAGCAMVAGEREDAKGRRGMVLWFETLDSEHAELVARLKRANEESDLWPADSGVQVEEEDTKPEANPAGIWAKYEAEGSDSG